MSIPSDTTALSSPPANPEVASVTELVSAGNVVVTPVGGEILVNTTTCAYQSKPQITALADGGFVITWRDFSQAGGDTSGGAVRAQVFEVGVNAVPEVTANDATAAFGASIPLAALFDWSDADGIDDIATFTVRDTDPGGGFLTVNGVPMAAGTVLGPIPIEDIDDWAFVPGFFGGGTVDFHVIDQ